MRLRTQAKSASDSEALDSARNLLISKAAAHDGSGDAHGLEAAYRFDTIRVADAVDMCVAGLWDMPDFQRGFVWKPVQSAMLADSIWRNYPTGFMLLWSAPTGPEAENSRSWIADGQQRLTSLCLLMGKRPSWWGRRPEPRWERMRERYDIRFDVENSGPSPVLCEYEGMDKDRFIPVPEIVADSPSTRRGHARLEGLVMRAKSAGHAPYISEEELFARLMRVAKLREKTILINAVSHEYRDVVEIFDRLNSRGIRFRWLMMRIIREALSAMTGKATERAIRELRERKRSGLR